MICEYGCYQIGGMYIAENPNCPVHGINSGEEEVISELRERVFHLEKKAKELEKNK